MRILALDRPLRRLQRLRDGDAPAKKDVAAEQHFTQPPPRFSEASLVKRMEELGIGRPSTYASIIKTLKDRNYVRVEKNRFFAEESGRLVTAFLERFFERYVGFDYTAELEEELDNISGGRAQWQEVLEAFWRDFKPRTAEVMEQKPSDITAELDKFLEPYLFPERADGSDPRLCPNCGEGKLFRAFLKTNDRCSACGQDFTHHRADDLPAYLVIVIVGHIVVPMALSIETNFAPPVLLQLAIYLPITLIASLALLQPVKGAVVGLQWAFRMHGFDEDDPPADPAGKKL